MEVRQLDKMFRREILEAIGHGVVFTDPAEKITYANRYF
ncbi:MAG TPA: hypothetical protein DHU71_12170, partial [Erythrobacter sp.]|nr:hypothetical protein [Erythrobacter sp.]